MNKEFLQNLREQIKAGTVTEQEPMNKHTSFAIGGPADVFVQPATRVIKFPACKSRSVKINHLFSFPSRIPVSYFCRQLLFPPDPGYSSH